MYIYLYIHTWADASKTFSLNCCKGASSGSHDPAIYIYICIYIHTYIYIHIIYIYNIYIHTHTHTYTYIHACMHAYIHTYIPTYIHILDPATFDSSSLRYLPFLSFYSIVFFSFFPLFFWGCPLERWVRVSKLSKFT